MCMLISTLLLSTIEGSAPSATAAFGADGAYTVKVDGVSWFESAAPTTCLDRRPLRFEHASSANGKDGFGKWTGTTATYSDASGVSVEYTFRHYDALKELVVGSAAFPDGLSCTDRGSNEQLQTRFPEFLISGAGAGKATGLDTLSWRGEVVQDTVAARGLGALGNTGLDCGPVVATDGNRGGHSLAWSTLSTHKIVPQETTNETYAMGIAAAIPSLPKGYSYSVMYKRSSLDPAPTAARAARARSSREDVGASGGWRPRLRLNDSSNDSWAAGLLRRPAGQRRPRIAGAISSRTITTRRACRR